MAAAWPFVGRSDELERVADARDSDDCIGVVLSGPPGVGKTRLAREAIMSAKGRGHPTEWVVGLSVATSIPLGAFTHLLPLSEAPGTDLVFVIRGLSHGLTELARAKGRRLVVGLDDADLLDDVSATLVHELAMNGGAFVVASMRTGRLPPGPIAAFVGDSRTERLDVRLLRRPDVERLVPAALGKPVTGATIQELWRTSGGNPLWLRELVLGGVESGALVLEGGVWRSTAPLTVNPRLTEVVDGRLAGLTAGERAAVEILAVGEPLAVDLLETLADRGSAESLERRGVVEVRADRRRVEVRLSHPLYGDVLRSTIPPLRARAIRARLADALEHTGLRRRDDVLRTAALWLEAGGTWSPHLWLTAAYQAMSAFDFHLGERLARAALDGGAGFPGQLALGQALLGQQRGEEAEELLRPLSDLADTDEARARLAIVRASSLFWSLGRPREAEQIVRTATDTVSDVAWRDALSALRATFLFFYAPMTDVLDAVATPLARPGIDKRTLVQCLLPAVGAWTFSGQIAQAMDGIQRGRAAAARKGVGLSLAEHQFRIVEWCALWLSGRVQDAVRLAEATFREATEANAHEVAAHWCMELGYSYLLEGRVRTAADRLREASILLREHDRWGFRHCAVAFLAHAAGLAGDVATAEIALSEAVALHPPHFHQLDGVVGLAPAWLASARGEATAAATLALEAAKLSRQVGQYSFEAVALHEVARLGQAARAASRLRELVQIVDGELIPAFADHADAKVANDGTALEGITQRFENMGMPLLAAEAAAEAAAAHDRAGLNARAQWSRRQSEALASRCEGASTPALRHAPLPRGGQLTAREQEVAGLAARGLSTHEIARRLVLSERTVENHLHHVYGKLGIRGRDQLRG